MELAHLTWPAAAALAPHTPVVIPVAALEQHGHHLPLFTDSLLLGEVLRRARLRGGEDVALFAPLVWLGNSDHHLEFAGTLSAPPRVYLDLLVGLADNLIRHGFRRIVFLNGHGGNEVPGRQAVFELRQRYRERSDLLLLFATYWSLGTRPAKSSLELEQREMGHACEWETSMLLQLDPNLVGHYLQAEDVPFGAPFLPAHRGWITADRTTRGHIGYPRHATAEKGELLFDLFSQDVAGFLRRVAEWDGRSWDG